MATKNNTESFVFYSTFLTSIEVIKNDSVQLAMFKAVINYGLYGVRPDFSDIDKMGILEAAFVQMQYAIDEAKSRRAMYQEFGRMGGAPKGSKNAAKLTQNNPTKPKLTQNNLNVYVNDNVNVNVNDNVISSCEDNKKSAQRFTAPSLDEIKAYCIEKGYNIEASAFYDYYTANGWVQGKGKPIKNWRAALNQWARREEQFKNTMRLENDTDVTDKKKHQDKRRPAEVTATSAEDYNCSF